MKIFCITVVTVTLAVFGPIGCYCQFFECVSQNIDPQCLGLITTVSLDSISTEERATLCNSGCVQSEAQAYVNCGDNSSTQSFIDFCTVNSQGMYCRDFYNDNETSDAAIDACSADFDCTGACKTILQDSFGCCGTLSGFNSIFSSCNVTSCDLPFVLGPPGTPFEPVTDPGAIGTDLPPLAICLGLNVYANQDLVQSCSEFIPGLGIDEMDSEMPTTMDSVFNFNSQEFCASQCAQLVVEAFYDCESKFGSVLSIIFSSELLNTTYAQMLQAGCSKDNLDPSRVCFNLIIDDENSATMIGEAASSEACQQSLQNGDCDSTCEAAINSLSCCTGTALIELFDFPNKNSVRLFRDYCNHQACEVPFPLDKAHTIHSGTVAVLVMIFASLSAIMGYF